MLGPSLLALTHIAGRVRLASIFGADTGGIAEGHGGIVHVLRRADNGLSDQVTIQLDDLLLRADPRVNIPIVANDLINVPASFDVTIYCLGEVEKPGSLTFKSHERITVLAAIAQAGGLTDRAASKIQIRRQGAAPPNAVAAAVAVALSRSEHVLFTRDAGSGGPRQHANQLTAIRCDRHRRVRPEGAPNAARCLCGSRTAYPAAG